MEQLPIRPGYHVSDREEIQNNGVDRVGLVQVMQVHLCVVWGCYSLGSCARRKRKVASRGMVSLLIRFVPPNGRYSDIEWIQGSKCCQWRTRDGRRQTEECDQAYPSRDIARFGHLPVRVACPNLSEARANVP